MLRPLPCPPRSDRLADPAAPRRRSAPPATARPRSTAPTSCRSSATCSAPAARRSPRRRLGHPHLGEAVQPRLAASIRVSAELGSTPSTRPSGPTAQARSGRRARAGPRPHRPGPRGGGKPSATATGGPAAPAARGGRTPGCSGRTRLRRAAPATPSRRGRATLAGRLAAEQQPEAVEHVVLGGDGAVGDAPRVRLAARPSQASIRPIIPCARSPSPRCQPASIRRSNESRPGTAPVPSWPRPRPARNPHDLRALRPELLGAWDPDRASVTRAFYDRGWRGINVEPVEAAARKLRAACPRDVTLQRAVGDAPETIHLLKVDAAGAEQAVLADADFTMIQGRRFRPWIILLEAAAPLSQEPTHAERERLILDAGCGFAWFDGLSRFYLADEHRAALAPHFAAPLNVFDSGWRPRGTEAARPTVAVGAAASPSRTTPCRRARPRSVPARPPR